MGILQTVQKQHIEFDPANEEHRAAFWKLRTTGKQDDALRFVCEEGYGSVLTMMQDKIACHFSRQQTAVVRSIKRGAK